MLEQFLGPVLVPRRYSRYLMLGCCLGVAAILVVLSLFANYFRAVETQLLGIHPHLSIRPVQEDRMLESGERERIEQALEGLDGVVVARPAIDRIAHLQLSSVESHPVVCRDSALASTCFDPSTALGSDTVRGVTGFTVDRSKKARVRLRGLDLGIVPTGSDPDGPMTLELERVLDVRGEGLDLGRLAKGPEQGMPMAGYFERRLFHGATPLDDFLFSSPVSGGASGSGGASPEALHHFRLLSTLHLGLRQDANPMVVTSIENAARILEIDSAASVGNLFEVRLDEPHLAPGVAETLTRRLDQNAPALADAGEAGSGHGGLEVRSWLEQDEGALRLLGVLRWVIFVVVSSVMVVAALGVMSTLSLVVLEGRQKIAMMRAMGLRDRNLYLALAIECFRIASAGLVSGLALGAAASWALLLIPGFAQGLGKMGVVDPRVMLQAGDLLAVTLATWALFLVVAWWPAREACQIDPVSGLRG